LFVGLLVTNIRRRVGRLFRAASDGRHSAGAPRGDDGTPPEPSPERRSKRTRALIGLAVAAGIVACGTLGHARLRVAGPFTIQPLHNADVRTETDGLVERVYVAEGDAVRAGDVIARLSDRAQRTDLAKTDAQLRETRAHVRMLETGPTADSIALARTALAQASTRLQYAHARLNRDRQLADSGVLTRVDLENT